jgi:hypothetical protein
MNEQPPGVSRAEKKARSKPAWPRLVLAALLGAGGTFVVIIIFMMLRGSGMERLTAERLEAAETRWEQNGPANYDIEVSVSGRQAAVYRVEVRRGQATSATRNGNPLTQLRTLSTWSVPGMFGTIHEERKKLEQLEAGAPGIPHLTVLVEFDSKYGFPRRYVRIESAGMGTANQEVTWEVRRFDDWGT